MKRTAIKKTIAAAVAVITLGATAFFGGCNAQSSREVINGKDLNIYDIYAAAKLESGNADMTFTEFLKEYLSYTSDELEHQASIKGAINRSLMSSVSVQSVVKEYEYGVERENAYSGSGVIIDVGGEKDESGKMKSRTGDMLVVTNCHVVYSAKSKRYSSDDGFSDNIHVWLYGSESIYEETYRNNAIPARLIAASKTYDVAVLKVEGSELVKMSKVVAAKWAEQEEVYLGETVYAIGNANSQFMSANIGYVSKDLEYVKVDLGTSGKQEIFEYGVMRTSVDINSGNSGGGLFNLDGEITGLINSKSKSEAAGFGYALTAASTRRVVQSMLDNYKLNGGETHYVKRVKHGITVDVSDMYSTGLNEDGYAEIYEQVRVKAVENGAARGKLQSGDILKNIKITRENAVIENMAITREHNFYDVMLSVRAGDKVTFTVKRGDGDITQEVSFGEDNFEEVI